MDTGDVGPDASFDMTIRWHTPSEYRRPDDDNGWYDFSAEVHRFGWPDVGMFEIFRGRDVRVHPAPNAPEGLIEHILLGPIVADALLSRGAFPLHASSVVIGTSAVAFVGPSGRGKSTLAGAMYRAGYPIHADDLLALSCDDPFVPFGISRIKLNPDSAQQLGDDPAQLGRVYEGIDKRSKVVVSSPECPPRLLKAIYRLTDSDALEIERIDPRRAIFEVFANCFFVEVEQHACGGAELLRRCAAVAGRVPVFALKRPRDFSRLHEVVAAVAEHASAL